MVEPCGPTRFLVTHLSNMWEPSGAARFLVTHLSNIRMSTSRAGNREPASVNRLHGSPVGKPGPWLVAVARGRGSWPWPVAVARGRGPWLWLVAVARGRGSWPVAMARGRGPWPWPTLDIWSKLEFRDFR